MAGSAPLIGANFADISNDNLILRRPRSGRLEGWATHGVVEKAGLQRLLGCPPFEMHRSAVLLRVRSRCKSAPMSGALPAMRWDNGVGVIESDERDRYAVGVHLLSDLAVRPSGGRSDG